MRNFHIIFDIDQISPSQINRMSHYTDIIMGTIASQITSLTIGLLNHLFKRRSKKTSKLRSLAFVWGIHRGPVNSPHKWPVTRKMFPFDDIIMYTQYCLGYDHFVPFLSFHFRAVEWYCVYQNYSASPCWHIITVCVSISVLGFS